MSAAAAFVSLRDRCAQLSLAESRGYGKIMQEGLNTDWKWDEVGMDGGEMRCRGVGNRMGQECEMNLSVVV